MHTSTSTYSANKRSWTHPLSIDDSPSTLVLAFGAPELRDASDVFQALRQKYPRAVVIGCSTAGEIGEDSVRDHSLVVSVTQFEATRLELATIEVNDPAESFAAGLLVARRLEQTDLRAVFLLSEGIHVNGSELVRGINSRLPSHVVTTGGLAGDGTDFGRTWIYDGSRVRERVVVAVGLYGDALSVTHGSRGGWQTKGREHTVTLSKGNVVFELDGRPALSVYEEYLGATKDELPASGLLFPLSMRIGTDDTKRLVRTLLAVDREKQSLTFAGDVPMHARVSVMESDENRLIAGAREASRTATVIPPPSDADSLAVAISCVGRRLLLKERARDEVAAVKSNLPARSHVVGFYSYGEICPFAVGHSDLHNQTMTLTVFSEPERRLARTRTSSHPPASGPASVRPSMATRAAAESGATSLLAAERELQRAAAQATISLAPASMPPSQNLSFTSPAITGTSSRGSGAMVVAWALFFGVVGFLTWLAFR
ncbi:MAG: FIST N-terminal domain-containing protein [Polyangiaceae bacterium]